MSFFGNKIKQCGQECPDRSDRFNQHTAETRTPKASRTMIDIYQLHVNVKLTFDKVSRLFGKLRMSFLSVVVIVSDSSANFIFSSAN